MTVYHIPTTGAVQGADVGLPAGFDTSGITGGTLTWDGLSAAAEFGDPYAILVTPSSTSSSTYIAKLSGLSTDNIAVEVAYYATALSAQDYAFAWVGTGSTRDFAFGFLSNGKIRLWNAANVAIWTSTNTAPLNDATMVKVFAQRATGAIRIAIYNGNSATPIEDSGTLTGQSIGAASYTALRVGKVSTGAGGISFWLTHFGYDDAATGLMPVWTAPPTAPPTGSATLSSNVSVIVATATAGQGGTLAYTLSPTTNVTTLAAGKWMVAPAPTDGAVQYTWVATESPSGLSVSGTQIVSPGATPGMLKRKRWTGTAWV